jgi:cold-inducible RNA-binding protein
MKKLYVGNLPYSFDDDALANLFAEYGEVISAKIIIDRKFNRSKGFGFVELEDDAAQAAVEKLNETEIEGRKIVVNEARPMRE